MKIIKFLLFLSFINQIYCSYQNRASDEECIKVFIAGDINTKSPAKYSNGAKRDNLIEINVSRQADSTYNDANVFSFLGKSNDASVSGSLNIQATINDINPTLRSSGRSTELIGFPTDFTTMYDESINLINKYFNLFEGNFESVTTMNIDELIKRGNKILENFDLFYQLTSIDKPDGSKTESVGLFTGNLEQFIIFEEKTLKVIRRAIIHQATTSVSPDGLSITISFNTNDNPFKIDTGGSVDEVRTITGSKEYIELVKGLIRSVVDNDKIVIKNNIDRRTLTKDQTIKDSDNTEGVHLIKGSRIVILKSNINGEVRYHPIVADESDGVYVHFNALKSNVDGTLTRDGDYIRNSLTFEECVNNFNHHYGKEYKENDNLLGIKNVKETGVSIVPLSGLEIQGTIELSGRKTNVYLKPIDYIRYDNNGDMNKNEIALESNIYRPIDNINTVVTGSKPITLNNFVNYKNSKDLKREINYNSNILEQEGVVSEYIDPDKYIHIHRIIQKFFIERVNDNSLSDRELLIMKYITGIYLCVEVFAINTENELVGIALAQKHPREFEHGFNTFNMVQRELNFRIDSGIIINMETASICKLGVIKRNKRMGSNCVYVPIKFKKDENINDSLLDIVTMFNDKNIDISNVRISYEDLYNIIILIL